MRVVLHVGDRIVYPMHGAGVIDAVEDTVVLGETKSYFVLKLPVGNMKVMIPVDNADGIGLRDVIGEDELATVVEVLRAKPEKIPGSWNKRFHINLTRMKSGDIHDVAAVARNLILQDRVKRISSGERRLLDLAKQILVSELVFVCRKSPAEVEAWIAELLGLPDDTPKPAA